jgi:hypothetical protein
MKYAVETGLPRRWYDMHAKYHKDWFRHSKVDREIQR